MKKILAAVAGLVLSAGVAISEPISLDSLNAYLNSLVTAQSRFTQVGPNGHVQKGMLTMQKPYRARFEYDDKKTLVLASGGQVAIFDAKSNTGAQQYPMNKTPLKLVLAPEVNLNGRGMVTSHGELDGSTIIVVQDPANPSQGNVEMLFTNGPKLRQWVVTDDTGKRTTVILDDLKTGMAFKPSQFAITSEIQKRQ